MPRDQLPLVSVQVLHWSGKRCSYNKPASCRACCAKEVWIATLLLVLSCSSSALADTFGLGTAGPGNWGILETGANQVSMANNSGISVNSGAQASQANLGINSGGKLNQSGNVVVQGTYYTFSTSSDSTTSGFTAVGGVNTTSTGLISTAAAAATSASVALAALVPNQTITTISSNTTISATVTGRNVIALTGQNLANITLTLNAPYADSFVINVTGGITFGNVNLIGGILATNVIFNVTGGNISLTNAVTVNGILMDINGTVSTGNTNTINGEIISGNSIALTGGSDVEVVETAPEPSTTAYFTLGPLSVVAVMLLHRRFSRRKQTIGGCSHDPVEGVLGAAK
jgi:hypothetical protein